jgi:hypothetical protein
MMSRELDQRPPRVHIIAAVLESALDAGASEYVEMCRRLIVADRRGWRTHADQADCEAVLEAYEEICLSGRHADSTPLIEGAKSSDDNRL